MSTDHPAISMSHQITDSRLRALIAQLREVVRDAGGSISKLTVARYADRLEAALAEGADPFELRCQYCGRETQHRTMGLCEGCVRKIVRWSATVPPEPSQEWLEKRCAWYASEVERLQVIECHCGAVMEHDAFSAGRDMYSCIECGDFVIVGKPITSPHQTPESR